MVDEFRYFKSDLRKSNANKGIFDKVFLEDEKQSDDQQSNKDKKVSMAVSENPNELKYLYRMPYYCLTFTLMFDHSDDTVFIAYSRPYKFSKIITDIVDIEASMIK